MALGSISGFIEQHSQLALLLMFVLLALESFGLPVPGETALIACSVLASQGALSIVAVIVVAVAAAVGGDNAGYWVARSRGRAFLDRYEPTRRYAARYLPKGVRFFARHGGKAVFLGRFVTVLRVTTAWSAGLSHMDAWRFFAWNMAGGIVWATGVALIAFYLGEAVAAAIGKYGLYAAGAAVILTVIGVFIARRLERRMFDAD